MIFKIVLAILLTSSYLAAKPNIVIIGDDWYATHYSCMNNDLFVEIYRIEDLAANNEAYEIGIENSSFCKMPYHSKAKIQWKEIYTTKDEDIPKHAIYDATYTYKFKLRECTVSEYLKYGNKSKFFCHTTKLPTEKELKTIILNSKFWGGM